MTRLLGYSYIRKPKIVRGYQTSISLEKLKALLPSGWKDKPDWTSVDLYLFIACECRRKQCSEYIVPSRYLAKKARHCHDGITRKIKKMADLGLLEKSHFKEKGRHFTKLRLTNNFSD
jgi:hypothetical protein